MNEYRETATYIANMLLELRNMAKYKQFKTLQGLLDISYYEAYGIAYAVEVPAGEEQLLQDLGADARKRAVA